MINSAAARVKKLTVVRVTRIQARAIVTQSYSQHRVLTRAAGMVLTVDKIYREKRERTNLDHPIYN